MLISSIHTQHIKCFDSIVTGVIVDIIIYAYLIFQFYILFDICLNINNPSISVVVVSLLVLAVNNCKMFIQKLVGGPPGPPGAFDTGLMETTTVFGLCILFTNLE